jgi:hypothetical protein
MTMLHQTRNSATELLLRCDPFRPQRAVTPKLTMIAGRQLSIGALSV